jgi:hypothetical protein
MQSVYDSHMNENKIIMKQNQNQPVILFKDKGDRLARKIFILEVLTNISNKLKKFIGIESFISNLRSFQFEIE